MRQNILNGKWFIDFTEDGSGIESAGQILGEASDGWFYVAIVSHSLTVLSRQVIAVGDLKSARFYNSETEMTAVRRQFGKPPGKLNGESK